MNDYERVARVIRYLDRHRLEQPDLKRLSQEVELSPHHLHRLFTSWAGITPKRFLQCLTVTHAKERLQAGESVLEAALEAGLSGPGRLHDLCVRLEAASPGELKAGGTGWSLVAGLADSPFGLCLLAEGPRGISHLSFADHGEEEKAWEELRQDWFGASLHRDDQWAEDLVGRIFAEKEEAGPGTPTLQAFVRGSQFQIQVWRALLQIPRGGLVSYGHLAEVIGKPKAARAVGSAVGANPISYLIPCHRVIRETGVLGKYRWGAERKQAMIAWETN